MNSPTLKGISLCRAGLGRTAITEQKLFILHVLQLVLDTKAPDTDRLLLRLAGKRRQDSHDGA